MNVSINDMKKMFAYIKRNKSSLKGALFAHKTAVDARNHLIKLRKDATLEVIMSNEYFIPQENHDIAVNTTDYRILCIEDAYLASEEDLEDMLKKEYAIMIKDSGYNMLAIGHENNPVAYEIDYSHQYLREYLKIEDELFNIFEKFTGFTLDQMICVKNRESYMTWISNAVNEH